jgi:hypothetical protein
MNEEERKKVKEFIKKHPISLGIFGIGLMFINLWMANRMEHDPFIHFIVMTFLVNGIAGLGFARVYLTLTGDRKNETTEKDS